MLASPRVNPSFSVHPAGPKDLEGAGDDLAHAAATDPDGVFLARSEAGVELGRASGVVRGDTLQLVHLFVAGKARGRGVGRALFDAVRAYGVSRGARALETVASSDPATLAFLLRRALPVRTLALRLEAPGAGAPAPRDALVPVAAAALAGWVADLDRETRGFSREKDWARWLRRPGGGVYALKRRGRPEALGALHASSSIVTLGPVEARTPEAGAALLEALFLRAAESPRVRLDLPAEARVLVDTAFALGFRLTASLPVLSARPRGDLRRYAASGTALF